MLTFTFASDEAGDMSFQFDKGASRYLVVAVIATSTPDELREVLTKIRQQESLPAVYEFGYHNVTSAELRNKVFMALQQADFEAWALIVDKTVLPEPFLLFKSGLAVYSFCISELIKAIPIEKRNRATLILDEFGNPEKTREEIKRMLKKRSIKHGFMRISMRESKREDLIQIADLVAGSILRRDAHNESGAYDMIAGKIVKLVEYHP
jgi:hypothetical protein